MRVVVGGVGGKKGRALEVSGVWAGFGGGLLFVVLGLVVDSETVAIYMIAIPVLPLPLMSILLLLLLLAHHAPVQLPPVLHVPPNKALIQPSLLLLGEFVETDHPLGLFLLLQLVFLGGRGRVLRER